MRIVILADTHGFLDPRIAADAAGADLVVHAGDVGPGIDAICAELGSALLIVCGNNDPVDAPWPQAIVEDLPGGQLAIMHGHQWPAAIRHRRVAERFPEAKAIVLGHSHRRVLERAPMPWLLNPGAAGKTRAYGGPSYIELIATGDAWQATPKVYPPLPKTRRRR